LLNLSAQNPPPNPPQPKTDGLIWATNADGVQSPFGVAVAQGFGDVDAAAVLNTALYPGTSSSGTYPRIGYTSNSFTVNVTLLANGAPVPGSTYNQTFRGTISAAGGCALTTSQATKQAAGQPGVYQRYATGQTLRVRLVANVTETQAPQGGNPAPIVINRTAELTKDITMP
jgi:hypothetical protein